MSKTGKQIFKNRAANVILVDYSELSRCSYIYLAQVVVSDIGLYMSKCIDQWKLSLSRTEFVGHSLGAHISGIAGYDLGGKVSRITGEAEHDTRGNRGSHFWEGGGVEI